MQLERQNRDRPYKKDHGSAKKGIPLWHDDAPGCAIAVRGPAARCGLMGLRVPQKTSTMVFGSAPLGSGRGKPRHRGAVSED
jgi:hypothetical protein